jgi:hypothetical protein
MTSDVSVVYATTVLRVEDTGVRKRVIKSTVYKLVKSIEGWGKLQNNGFDILHVINILRVIKSKEISTVGI